MRQYVTGLQFGLRPALHAGDQRGFAILRGGQNNDRIRKLDLEIVDQFPETFGVAALDPQFDQLDAGNIDRLCDHFGTLTGCRFGLVEIECLFKFLLAFKKLVQLIEDIMATGSDKVRGCLQYRFAVFERRYRVSARGCFDPAYAMDFWDITNREDWGACESVQRGMDSGFAQPGPLSPDEDAIYQFVTMVARGYLGQPLAAVQEPANA